MDWEDSSSGFGFEELHEERPSSGIERRRVSEPFGSEASSIDTLQSSRAFESDVVDATAAFVGAPGDDSGGVYPYVWAETTTRAGALQRTLSQGRPESHGVREILDYAHDKRARLKQARRSADVSTKRYELFLQQVEQERQAKWAPEDGLKMLTTLGASRGRQFPRIAAGEGASTLEGELDYKVLEISTYFDQGEQKGCLEGGAGLLLRPMVRDALGPIAMLFRAYAGKGSRLVRPQDEATAAASWPKLPEHLQEKKQVAYPDKKPSTALNTSKDPVVSFRQVVTMFEDLELCPEVLGRKDLRVAFQAAHREQELQGMPRRVGNILPPDLRYPGFCTMLVLLALSSPASAWGVAQSSGNRARIDAFLAAAGLNCFDTRPLELRLSRIRGAAHERGLLRRLLKQAHKGRRAGLQMPPAVPEYDLADAPVMAIPSSPLKAATDIQPQVQQAEAWQPGSGQPVPQLLMRRLLQHERPRIGTYRPCWQMFTQVKLDCCVVWVGAVRHYKVLLRSRAKRQLRIRLDASEIPFAKLEYNSTHMVYGEPRAVKITATFTQPGEFVGTLRVAAHDLSRPVAAPEVHGVPVFARVLPHKP